MISHLSGTVLSLKGNLAIINVNGVGYRVFVTDPTIPELKVGEEKSLWTYLAVRENALDLYGFTSEEELAFFELLITISGIGPKSALGILNVATVESLKNAIYTENTANLIRVSGISKKTAEKIVLELKGKLDGGVGVEIGITHDDGDALEALMSLGYSQKEAREALQAVPKEAEGAGERVKAALKILSK